MLFTVICSVAFRSGSPFHRYDSLSADRLQLTSVGQTIKFVFKTKGLCHPVFGYVSAVFLPKMRLLERK